jgi:hypothetical protein
MFVIQIRSFSGWNVHHLKSRNVWNQKFLIHYKSASGRNHNAPLALCSCDTTAFIIFQACILAVGKTEKVFIPDESHEKG